MAKEIPVYLFVGFLESGKTKFIQETFDETGQITHWAYTYADNYNYSYDVIDPLGERCSNRLAMLWRNDRGEEKRLTFGALKTLSIQAANLFQSRGLKKGDVIMTALRTQARQLGDNTAFQVLDFLQFGRRNRLAVATGHFVDLGETGPHHQEYKERDDRPDGQADDPWRIFDQRLVDLGQRLALQRIGAFEVAADRTLDGVKQH